MKTYLSVLISSEGTSASDITEQLQNLGFETTMGSHDFVYDWKNNDVATEEVITFVDKVQRKLKGMNVRFNLTTFK